MKVHKLATVALSVGAAIVAPQVHAQVSTGATASGQRAAQSTADAAQMTGEIVVTAQKKSESLQSVPAAVSVLDTTRLTDLGVTNLTQISNLVPGISVTPVRTQAFIFIRGVGQTLTSPNADPAVATNLNGVYLPAEIAGTAFFDVDRLEVLPGPQGTLYGRNSTGGVVNIISRTPRNVFGANASLELGNYSRVDAIVGVDVPLAAGLASRTAATFIKHKGYFNNGLDDQRTSAARETLLWNPTDRTRILGTATVTHDGGIGNAVQDVPYRECGPRCATFDPRALGFSNRSNAFEGSLQVEQGLTDEIDLTYIGGYNNLRLDLHNTIFTGPPLAPLFIQEKIKNQSHELRLNGKFGKAEGILGAYYFDQSAYFFQDASPTPAQRLINPFNGGSDGYAVFGETTYSLADPLRITGGLRYSHTNKSINGFNSTYNPAGAQILFRPYSGSSSLVRGDWKVAVEYDVTHNSMLYGNVSTGFTPGGFSTGPAVVGQTPAASFKPVYLRAYAGGIKNRLFDRLLTLNIEGFYYDYKNYQVSARDILTAQNLVFTADKATVYGAQIDSRLNLGRRDEASLSGTYLHAIANTLVTPIGSFNGFDLPYSPKWTVNAFYQHSFDLDAGAQIRASANFKYTSHRWSLYTHAPGFDIESNTHTDFNLGYFTAGDKWSLQAFVRNLEDKVVKTTCANVLPPAQAGCFFEPPRTYGATLSYKY